MATRFYLQSSGSTIISPTPTISGSEWDNTTGFRRLPMVKDSPGGSTMTTFTDSSIDSTSSEWFCRFCFVCPTPLEAQTIASGTTISWGVRGKEGAAAYNAQFAGDCVIYAPNGSTKRGNKFRSGTTELSATTLTGRVETSTTWGSTVSVSAGDFICFQLGWDITATGSGKTFDTSIGDDSASDVTSADTSADNAWFEISQTLNFQVVSGANALMMLGVGT